MMRAFLEHTKCPPSIAEGVRFSEGSGQPGFFRSGDVTAFGRTDGVSTAPKYRADLPTLPWSPGVGRGAGVVPFNPTEIIENLRQERYVAAVDSEISYVADHRSPLRRAYYALRPLLPVQVRRVFQRYALQDWAKIPFPRWPVDTTVEDLIDQLWIHVLRSSGEREIPFIWYWPDGHRACAIMTHDVETAAGQDFCGRILELERAEGVRSAFELVPEVRYEISAQVVDAIRQAGSEVCIHGLNHDGRLFSSEEIFRSRVVAINRHAAKWGAKGFRSPIMYRQQDWYDGFDFSYDMSVPNVAHLDPQRGGCCTIFPYFIGNVVELPLTTIQDYPLYNILRIDALGMWRQQLETIVGRHGLASFIIHPDYTMEPERQALYSNLLKLLREYGDKNETWLALPGEVDAWWRARHCMKLEREGGTWRAHGSGADRAVVAYARLDGDRVTYVLPSRQTALAGAAR